MKNQFSPSFPALRKSFFTNVLFTEFVFNYNYSKLLSLLGGIVNSFLSILYLKWNRFFLYILKIQRSEISFFGKINYTFISSYVASYLLHFLCLRIIFKRRKSWNWRIKSGQTEEKLEARIIEITKKKNYNKTGTQPKLLFRKVSDTALLYRTFDEKC